MVVIAGYSRKLNGFIFTHEGTQEQAIQSLCETTGHRLVVTADKRRLLIHPDASIEQYQKSDGQEVEYGDAPGRDGWELSVGEADNQGFANGAVNW